jgi:Ca-activated chloride channel family protein
MMPFGFSTPLAGWLALLAIPLVAFYFLKLKRPQLEVPSLVLWQQVLNDARVNSPFQRFKRNLLLWLQLLLLLLLVLAAMQPYRRAGPGRAMRLPILIDCSASMAARDRPGGESRLDVARGRAAERIDGMVRGQQVCLIAVGRSAQRLTDFTDNKRELLAALHALEVRDVESDLEDALRMAQALSRATSIDEVLLLSDGNIPSASSVELPFVLTFERIGRTAPNAGITSLRAVRSGSTAWRVFVGVDASETYRSPATLEADMSGEPVMREVIAPTFEAPERVAFVVPGHRASHVEVRLKADGFDALAADNIAYLDLPALRPAHVYVPPRLPACRRAFDVMEDLLLWPGAEATGASPASYDVVVSDATTDMTLAAPISFSTGLIPAALTGVVARVTEPDRVIDWQHNDPLLQHVVLHDVLLTAGTRFTVPHGVAACEARGYQVIVHGEHGPILVRHDSPLGARYAWLVPLDATTLPYRVALPVMLANLVRTSLQREGLADASAATTGVISGLTAAPGQSCTVRQPGGGHDELVADEKGRLPGLAAFRAGRYRVGGSTPVDVGVSPLSPHETRLTWVDRLSFAEVAVTAATEPARRTRALWPVFTVASLMLLLLEWWFFHRIQTLVHRRSESPNA